MNCSSIKIDNLSKESLIRQIRSDFQVIVNDGACRQCLSAIYSVAKTDKDWLAFNLDSGFSPKQFAKDLNTIKTQYPMLNYVANCVNSYRADEQVYKDIIDYIKLCEKN